MAKMPVLSTEQLLAAVDLRPVEFEVAELGGSVVLRAFTIDERDALMAEVTDNGKEKVDGNKLIRMLVVRGVIQPQFTLEMVGRTSYAIIEKIAQKVMELNGMPTEKKGPSADTVADVTF